MDQERDHRASHNNDMRDQSVSGNTRRSARSEKRKSEVLIAAQSLDSELQHVKNLKRMSFGSMDLPLDPEMEFRMSPSHSQRSSSSDAVSLESQAEEPNQDDDSDDNLSYLNDSIELTAHEYLEEPRDFLVERSSVSKSEDSHNGRNLSGVRRGGISKKPRELSNSGDDNVTQNLFWVPANQHPNVKPENYLELVQDTLHTLSIDSEVEPPTEKTVEGNNPYLASANTKAPPSSQLRSGQNSLVRRPSGLRKSYTELEDLLQHEIQDSDENNENAQSELNNIIKNRPRATSSGSSLKDITEELTRISNKAGFTDGDAVCLARTLSMASSYDGEQSQANQSTNTDHTPDSEYASTILTKNGLAIPARSSLRRSKFNTYRIRTPNGSSVTSSSLRSTSLPNEERKDPEGNIEKSDRLRSPTSVNDFNEIYDHYRQGSVGSTSEPHAVDNDASSASPLNKSLVHPSHHETHLNEESESSSKHSTDKTLSYPLEKDGKGNNNKAKNKENKPSGTQILRKKSSWNWFGKKTSKDQDIANDDEQNTFSDFLSVSGNAKTSYIPTEKVNHSRHRHYSIDSGSRGSIAADPSKSAVSSSPKKQKREKKFIQLFKRSRTASTGSRDKEDKVNYLGGTSGNPTDMLKTKASSRNVSKPTLDVQPAKIPTIGGERRSASLDESSLDKGSDLDQGMEKSVAKLQPSVCLTSKAKNEVSTPVHVVEDPQVQGANKLDGEHQVEPVFESDTDTESETDLQGSLKQGFEVKQSASVEKAGTQPVIQLEEPFQQKQASRKDVQDSSPVDIEDNAGIDPMAPAAGGYTLPPRKLTYSDVVKPERPNSPMKFSDSSFGFPLPPLTISTVVMIDHRLPINVERAIYRLSHLKLGDPKRELRQQVVLSNFMYAYLNLVNHSLYLQQLEEDNAADSASNDNQGVVTP